MSGGEGEEPQGEGFSHAWLCADDGGGVHQRRGDFAAAGIPSEGDGAEEREGAAVGVGPGLGFGGREGFVGDPEHETVGVLVGVGFGPYAVGGAAEAGGETVAAVGDVAGGDTWWEVDVGAPSGAVTDDR